MLRRHKILLTMGSAMVITSSAAMAGPPGGIAYNGFTATNGTISAPCPSAASSCGAAITGNGFFQRSLVISGVTYYQTIVLPTGANVASPADLTNIGFSDENFVQQGGGTGIADNQHLFAATTSSNPGNFTANTAINSGWAQGTGSVINLNQTVNDPATSFNVGFSLTGDGTNTTSLNVTESVNLGGTDHQNFDLRQITATSAGNTSAFLLPNGSSIAWVSGDVIQAVWMGQQVTASGAQLSGFIGYTNVTSNVAVSYTDQTATGPTTGAFNGTYDTTVFGAVPTF